MSTLAGEFWVCGQCRSINNAGAKQCYNCRTPKDRAAVDPATIDPTTKGQIREIELPDFRSSRAIAVLASVLILAIAALQVYNTIIASTLINQELDGTPATVDQLQFVGSMAFLTLGFGALALISWSLWLSRSVSAMPALGLGYPAADGFMAFVENFIPGFNLFRVPAIVRDVVHRLEPLPGRGDALIFAAWISLLGGFFVPRIAVLLSGVTARSSPDTLRRYLTIEAIAMGFVVIGAVFLVALIWWVEARIARRRTAQLADLSATHGASSVASSDVAPPAAAVPSPAEVVLPTLAPPAPQVEPDVVYTRSPFAAAGPAAETPAAALASAPPPESPPPFSLPRVDAEPGVSPWNEPTFMSEPAPEPGPPPEPPTPEREPVAESSPEPVAAAAEPEPIAAVPQPAPPPAAEPGPAPEVADVAQVAAVSETADGRPHLTIRVTPRGMITAEMDGETEHVILDDLEAYGSALAKVDGTAVIVAATEDSMAALIARRARRILEEAGVQVTVD
jgi:hypothetical protein